MLVLNIQVCHSLPRSGHPSKLTSSSDHVVARETDKKKPTIPSQAPQASVVKVQVSTIRRTQKRYGLLERAVRRMTLYSKKTMAAWLGLGKLHLKKPGDF